MVVRTKLMGVLRRHTPEGGTLTLPEGACIQQALDALGLPAKRIHAVSVNGDIERDWTRRLGEDDELTVLPPASGG